MKNASLAQAALALFVIVQSLPAQAKCSFWENVFVSWCRPGYEPYGKNDNLSPSPLRAHKPIQPRSSEAAREFEELAQFEGTYIYCDYPEMKCDSSYRIILTRLLWNDGSAALRASAYVNHKYDNDRSGYVYFSEGKWEQDEVVVSEKKDAEGKKWKVKSWESGMGSVSEGVIKSQNRYDEIWTRGFRKKTAHGGWDEEMRFVKGTRNLHRKGKSLDGETQEYVLKRIGADENPGDPL